jgi:hypothetical protein
LKKFKSNRSKQALEVRERSLSHGLMVRDDRAINLEAMDHVFLAAIGRVLVKEGRIGTTSFNRAIFARWRAIVCSREANPK